VVHSKGKLVTAPMIIEAESFYDEIRIVTNVHSLKAVTKNCL
jgi:hypothetical protein